MNQASRTFGWTVSILAGIGCHSSDKFDTRHGEMYCGSLVGQGAVSTGFEELGWEGTSNKSTLALTLNTAELYKKDGIPSVMTSNDATFGPCKPSHALFEQAKVRNLGAALGDRLSSMRLNDDHEEDIVTYVDSTCSGSMVGILSLVKNGDVEMRLLRPAPLSATNDAAVAETDKARFGLFVLSKSKTGCGF
jgi:hypothetical protein